MTTKNIHPWLLAAVASGCASPQGHYHEVSYLPQAQVRQQTIVMQSDVADVVETEQFVLDGARVQLPAAYVCHAGTCHQIEAPCRFANHEE